MYARDIMSTSFRTLEPEMSIELAVATFQQATDEQGRRVFGMMVIDADDHLAGIVSMYDILTLLQPKHVHIWGEMSDIDLSGLLETMCARHREIKVGDIMSTDIVTVAADTHLFTVLELMNRHHIRRLPVIEEEHVVGIVYLSDLFFALVDLLQDGDT